MTQVIISVISVGLPILAAQVVIIINAINDNKHKDALIEELQKTVKTLQDKVLELQGKLDNCSNAMTTAMSTIMSTINSVKDDNSNSNNKTRQVIDYLLECLSDNGEQHE